MVAGACGRSWMRSPNLRKPAASRRAITRRFGPFGCSSRMARWSRRSRSSRPASTPAESSCRPQRASSPRTRWRGRERPVEELDGALTDRDGNVQLQDGSYLHGVELIPVHLPEELTETEKEVLLCVLDVLGLKKECYRPLDAELVPGLEVLDFALVAQVGAEQLPSLKAIEREVFRRMPHIKRQTLATVLARAGLRRPRSGKRARPRSSATI